MIEMQQERALAAEQHHLVPEEQNELSSLISRYVSGDGVLEPFHGLNLARSSSPSEPIYGVYAPSFCVIAQGAKEARLGETRYRYDPAHYLVVSAELPITFQVTEASEAAPYLGFRLNLDPTLIGSVMVEAGIPSPQRQTTFQAVGVSPLDEGLFDAVVRLVRLLECPSDVRYLAPLITREIIYRLLVGNQAHRLRHIARMGGQTQRIIEAIDWFRNNFDQPLRVDEIAREFGMSVSGFHHHFKEVTTMSPIQFQKQLQLQEARRLMVSEGLDVTSAGYRVGYRNVSQFSREYKRMFGAPPLREVERLRQASAQKPFSDSVGKYEP